MSILLRIFINFVEQRFHIKLDIYNQNGINERNKKLLHKTEVTTFAAISVNPFLTQNKHQVPAEYIKLNFENSETNYKSSIHTTTLADFKLNISTIISKI